MEQAADLVFPGPLWRCPPCGGPPTCYNFPSSTGFLTKVWRVSSWTSCFGFTGTLTAITSPDAHEVLQVGLPSVVFSVYGTSPRREPTLGRAYCFTWNTKWSGFGCIPFPLSQPPKSKGLSPNPTPKPQALSQPKKPDKQLCPSPTPKPPRPLNPMSPCLTLMVRSSSGKVT